MKISKALFDDPRAARNVAETMHEAPRESRAWLGWLLAGLVVGGGVVDVWHMVQERLARHERFRQEGFVDQGNGVWVRERPGQRTVITLNGGSR